MKRNDVILAVGLLLVFLGAFMVINDYADIGSFTHSGDRDWKGVDWSFVPDWVHHWWIGILILILGLYVVYITTPYAKN